jgi:ATP/maltotriose-dependent transcriptional regulator MalT
MAVNAERGGDSRMKALSYLLQGRSAANAGDSENASRLLERALDGMLATENQIGVVLALMALGVLDDWRGRSDDALTHYRNALRFAEGCGSKSLQAAIQQNMSTAYALTGQLDAAVTAGDEAIAIKRAMGDQLFLGGALINVAVALCLQGSLAEALLYADEARMLCREVGDTKHECDEMVVRSEIYLRYGNLSAAAADVVAVLILARKVSNRYAMAAALRQQAKIEGANGRWHDAARIRARASDKYALLATRKDPLIERLLSETEPAWLAGLQKQGELAGQQTDLQARAGHEAP